ncbi:uncharacterized membrane protein YcaP (DUF421 family) [Anaerosolibacter carboniphilus]|uniref:Uncharacterized membrane protein YcaP (DUF421 family) n=1 Tax=Anaerosolibacter carboniphilus TaxID=1417629 RepID=A0A841KRC3_9FIRM|nr:DUF421 domain-containing protein [Anaerosolibacter carboniphilus]MBB6215911.1 uncharacterized membrane protein YcaP (DUF421 family) [Anaerosolibacter carboniphilus]
MKEWLVILLRSVGLFFGILIFIRVMGRKQIARMTPFHFVSYGVIAILAALISTNIIKNLSFGLVALSVWIFLPIGLDYVSMKSKWLHDVLNGREKILVKDGKVMEENLKQLRITGEELMRELRSKNAFLMADVEFAMMETTGEINVLLKSDKKPVTPYDLGKKVAPQMSPQTVILDGNVLDEPLSNMGLNQGWLGMQLMNMGVSLDNVFLGQVDASGDLYVDLFDDSLQQPQVQVKELLYATLEKCQADLMSFALETQDEKAKKMYEMDAQKLQEVLQKLKAYLLR